MVIDSGAGYIIKQLEKNGYEAYVVGGCVRDAIMGKKPYDWDICTSARPEIVKNIFEHTAETGVKHGTVTVIRNGIPYEVTTMRTEGIYKDNRHPEAVSFVEDIETDLARRDFTVNAMAYNNTKGIIDIFGGQKDIQKKVIKCVGEPDKRFNEDGLRIMRAIRFAAVLGFGIEKKTSLSIHKNRALLHNIAYERIQTEFVKLICGKNPDEVLEEYADVISEFIPGFSPDVKMNASPAEPIVRTALFFYNIENVEAEKHLKRMHFPNAFIDDIVKILEFRDFNGADKYAVKRVLSKIGTELFEKLLAVQENTNNDVSLPRNLLYEIVENNECFEIKNMDINGKDLMQAGLKGKEVGDCLTMLLDAVIAERVLNKKEELMKYVITRTISIK